MTVRPRIDRRLARRGGPVELLRLPSLVFAGLARIRSTSYARGWLPRARVPVPVVSIGNLSAGGTGKTPCVAFLVRALQRRGLRAGILSRGYGAPRASTAHENDEARWFQEALPGVPAVQDPDRVRGACALVDQGVEVIVLDDGFQHHRLARDLDLVCIDATVGLGNRWTLPRGPLREPLAALRCADALVFTRAPELEPGQPAVALPGPATSRTSAERREWQRQRQLLRAVGVPEFAVAIRPSSLRPLGGGPARPRSSLDGESVGVLAAIARPEQVIRSLEALGARVVRVEARADHHAYSRAEISALDPALRWVTTAKDAVKIPAEWTAGRELDVLEETVAPLPPTSLADWVCDRLDLQIGAPTDVG